MDRRSIAKGDGPRTSAPPTRIPASILKCCATRPDSGLPKICQTDHGLDYSGRDMTGETPGRGRKRRQSGNKIPPVQGIYATVGIEHTQSIPYNARAKIIERWHRTIKEQFCRGMGHIHRGQSDRETGAT